MKRIHIRFQDNESERRALGYMAGRFSLTSYATGESIVPESALAALAREDITFVVEGPAAYVDMIPILRTRGEYESQ
jgi:hypothetical protein